MFTSEKPGLKMSECKHLIHSPGEIYEISKEPSQPEIAHLTFMSEIPGQKSKKYWFLLLSRLSSVFATVSQVGIIQKQINSDQRIQ